MVVDVVSKFDRSDVLDGSGLSVGPSQGVSVSGQDASRSVSGVVTRSGGKVGSKTYVRNKSAIGSVVSLADGKSFESEVADAAFHSLLLALESFEKRKYVKVPCVEDYTDPVSREVASLVQSCVLAYYKRLYLASYRSDDRARHMSSYVSVKKTPISGGLAMAKKSHSIAVKKGRLG